MYLCVTFSSRDMHYHNDRYWGAGILACTGRPLSVCNGHNLLSLSISSNKHIVQTHRDQWLLTESVPLRAVAALVVFRFHRVIIRAAHVAPLLAAIKTYISMSTLNCTDSQPRNLFISGGAEWGPAFSSTDLNKSDPSQVTEKRNAGIINQDCGLTDWNK